MTEPDDDEQAHLDLYDGPPNPLADHGRPAGRLHRIPYDRPLEDVLETL